MTSSFPRSFQQILKRNQRYPTIRIRTGGRTSSFTWHYEYPHSIHDTTASILSRVINPLRYFQEEKYANADYGALWNFVYFGTKLSKKAVIRRFYVHRIRKAIKAGLTEMGLDGKARRLDTSGNVVENEAVMLGSLHVYPANTIVDNTKDAILGDAKKMLAKVRSVWQQAHVGSSNHSRVAARSGARRIR